MSRKKEFSNKNLVKRYLRLYPPNEKETLSIKTIYFDTFNLDNDLDTQKFALISRCKLNNFRRTNILLLGYRYKKDTLSLDEGLKQDLATEYSIQVLDESDLA